MLNSYPNLGGIHHVDGMGERNERERSGQGGQFTRLR